MKVRGVPADALAAPPPGDDAPPLRLQLLRTPLLISGDASIPLNRLDAALLAVLALDGPTSRARIVGWLWPEHDADAARNVLRQRLFRLRRTAGHDLVVAEELLVLAPGIGHDLGSPDALLATDPHASPGELLGDAAYDDLLEFGGWLAAARVQWRAVRRDALAGIAARLESEDRIALAVSYADRLARDEPLLEHAHRRLMRLHYRRGDRGAALAAYGRYAESLDRELGETPSRETRDLLDLIESNEAPPATASPPRPVAVLRPPRLVGRAAEWRRLEAAFASGRLGVIGGEPGIGKSRLLGDFAAARTLVVVPTRPGDARMPYALLARLLRSLAAATTAATTGTATAATTAVATLATEAAEPSAAVLAKAGSAAAAATIPAALADDFVRTELARIVPEFGASAPGRLDPLRLQRATTRFVAACKPAGIAIDDLQFADDATLDMLPGLVAASDAPWLLALRANEQPASVAAWLDTLDPTACERIALGPLDVGGVEELLATLALPQIEPAQWAARVHRHSGGNPMFILETLLALLAGGVAPGDGARLPLPENLRVLIERRLAQLSAPALKLARVAALAGADFSVDVAAGVLELHPLDLLEGWRELEAAQVVRDAAFAHDLILEASRDSVPAPLRRWLHGRIAAVLEQQGSGAPLRLAHHWREAHEPARAATQFLRAADLAQAAGRLSEESRLLEAAIECHVQAGNSAGRFDAMARRAVSALESLSPTDALQAAHALAAAATDLRERGIAHKQLAACHMNGARFDLAAPELERAIASSDAAGDPQSANHARYLLALALAQTVGVGAAVERIETLLPWAESQPDESLRHSFFADLAILWDQADQRRRARPYFERALGYFERRRETGNAASTRMMYARSLLMMGELEKARGQLEAAVRDRDELSEGEGGQGIEVLNLGRAYAELGLYAEALQLLEPSRERLARHGLSVVAGASALVIARVHAHLGQTARAQAMFREVPEDPPFHLRAALLWSKALLLHERPGERRRLLDEAVAQFAQTDLPFVRLPIQFDQIACSNDAAAVDACRSLVAECERRELPAPQMLGRMRLAQMLVARGDAATALAVVQGLVPDLETCLPVGTYLPEFHWVCHLAARDGGDAALAAHCLAAAAQWIRTTAAAHVPDAFRESFLQRNPINRAILAAAARR